MSPKNDREIDLAWERITRALERPEELPPRRPAQRPPEIQLWTSGRGGTWRWAVLAPSEGGAPVVREVFMSLLTIGALREDPTITIEQLVAQKLIRIREATLDRAELDRRLEAARTIAVPLAGIDVPLGFDGAMTGLVIHAGFQTVSISWWSEPPREWKPLVKWADDLCALFERCFEER